MVGLNRLLVGLGSAAAVYAASSTPVPSATVSTARTQFTVPAAADEGQNLIANIDDPQAVDAQSVCPGYKASHVSHKADGLTATLTLAGEACNVYGTDVDSLDLAIRYLGKDRLSVKITPTHIDSSNASWYLLPEDLVPSTKADKHASAAQNDLEITWTNKPSFQFRVIRRSTRDVLFDTYGSVLVFEDQFIEFATALPPKYNLYGIGEHIQQSRLLENLTLTLWAADIADPIDS